jgi:hypothetical protein
VSLLTQSDERTQANWHAVMVMASEVGAVVLQVAG